MWPPRAGPRSGAPLWRAPPMIARPTASGRSRTHLHDLGREPRPAAQECASGRAIIRPSQSAATAQGGRQPRPVGAASQPGARRRQRAPRPRPMLARLQCQWRRRPLRELAKTKRLSGGAALRQAGPLGAPDGAQCMCSAARHARRRRLSHKWAHCISETLFGRLAAVKPLAISSSSG